MSAWDGQGCGLSVSGPGARQRTGLEGLEPAAWAPRGLFLEAGQVRARVHSTAHRPREEALHVSSVLLAVNVSDVSSADILQG